jgi:hypothetical protein
MTLCLLFVLYVIIISLSIFFSAFSLLCFILLYSYYYYSSQSFTCTAAAYVYQLSCGTASLMQTLTTSSWMYYANSMAITNQYLIIGAPYDSQYGAVFVYEIAGSVWTAQTTLIGPSSVNTYYYYSYFGYKVSACSQYAMVGAFGAYNQSGGAFIYSFSPSFTSTPSFQPSACPNGVDDDFTYAEHVPTGK